MKTLMVIGGSGYLGSAAIREFRADYNVVSVDVLPPRYPDSDPSLFFLCDILDRQRISSVFRLANPDAVLLFAAVSTIDAGYNDPNRAFLVNSAGIQNVLYALNSLQELTGKTVPLAISSTDKVMKSQPPGSAYNGNTPIEPNWRSPYDVSKATEELIVSNYAAQGNPALILRQCNIIGGVDLNFSRIVPGTITKILRRETVIIRRNYNHDSGIIQNYVRTFLDCNDLMSAYKLCIAAMLNDGWQGGRFCIAPATTISNVLSVPDMVNLIADVIGVNPLIRFESSPFEHEIISQKVDGSAFESKFHFRALTSARQSVESAVVSIDSYLRNQTACKNNMVV